MSGAQWLTGGVLAQVVVQAGEGEVDRAVPARFDDLGGNEPQTVLVGVGGLDAEVIGCFQGP